MRVMAMVLATGLRLLHGGEVNGSVVRRLVRQCSCETVADTGSAAGGARRCVISCRETESSRPSVYVLRRTRSRVAGAIQRAACGSWNERGMKTETRWRRPDNVDNGDCATRPTVRSSEGWLRGLAGDGMMSPSICLSCCLEAPVAPAPAIGLQRRPRPSRRAQGREGLGQGSAPASGVPALDWPRRHRHPCPAGSLMPAVRLDVLVLAFVLIRPSRQRNFAIDARPAAR